MEFLMRSRFGRRTGAALLAVAALLLVCGASLPAAGAPMQLEQKKIEAGLLYNLLKHTDWSKSRASAGKGDPVRICLLGGDAFSGALSPLVGRTAQQRVIEIVNIADLNTNPEQCSLVFFHPRLAKDLETYLSLLRNRNIMTASNIKGFAKSGGMIEFSKGEDSHIHIYMNSRVIAGSGLSISEQMTRLARRVDGP